MVVAVVEVVVVGVASTEPRRPEFARRNPSQPVPVNERAVQCQLITAAIAVVEAANYIGSYRVGTVVVEFCLAAVEAAVVVSSYSDRGRVPDRGRYFIGNGRNDGQERRYGTWDTHTHTRIHISTHENIYYKRTRRESNVI